VRRLAAAFAASGSVGRLNAPRLVLILIRFWFFLILIRICSGRLQAGAFGFSLDWAACRRFCRFGLSWPCKRAVAGLDFDSLLVFLDFDSLL
jgi:hypothetical protein